MLSKGSEKIASWIYKAGGEPKTSIEVMTYSLTLLLMNGSILGLTLGIGWLDGHFRETCLAMGATVLLRFFSGGWHVPSPEGCVAVSTAVFVLIPFIPFDYSSILAAASLVLVLRYAPAMLNDDVRGSMGHFRYYKLISVLIAASNLLIQSPTVMLAFLIQGLTLIHRRR